MRNKLAKALSIILSVAMMMGSVSVPVGAAELKNDAKAEVVSEVEAIAEESTDEQIIDEVIDEAEDETDAEESAVEETDSKDYSEEIPEDEETADDELVIEDEVITEEMPELSEDEIQADRYEVIFTENGSDEADITMIQTPYDTEFGPVYDKADEKYYANGNDLAFSVSVNQKVILNAEYTINGVTKKLGTKAFSGEDYYYIPKTEIKGNVTVNLVTKEKYTNIPLNFNDGEGCHFTYEVIDGSKNDDGKYVISEENTIPFRVTADEGYKVLSVTASIGYVFTNSDGSYSYFMPLYTGEKPESIDIVVIIGVEGQKISKVEYDPKAVDVTIAKKSDLETKIEPEYVSEIDSDGRKTESYMLNVGTDYRITISCKQGYSFNENGVGKATLDDAGMQNANATHSNKNTTNTYTCDFKAGGFVFYSNTTPKYTPVIKVNGATVNPVNGIYSVSYLDTLNVSIIKGTDEESATLVLLDGTKEIGRSSAGSVSFGKTAYGKTLNAEMYVAGVDKPVSKFKIQVSTPVTEVKATGVKVVNKVQVLSPVIGESVSCALAVNKGASIDDLGYKVTDNDFLNVSIDNGKLVVSAAGDKKANQSATITLYDTKNTVAWDEQNITNGTIVVTTAAPAWAKSALTASLVNASDVVLNLKAAAPKSITLNDKFYVAVKLTENTKTKVPEGSGLTVNNTVKYYRVTDGAIPDIEISAFKKNGEETSTLGEGCGTSMDASIYLVLTSDGATPNEGADGNVLVTTVAKKVTAATKTPYYADKISLKKGTTNLYAGQSGVKIADINLGTKTTYNTTAFWEVKSVVDADGIDASTRIELKTGTEAGKSITDTGIYASVVGAAPTGKYKVTVKTKDGFYAPEASIDITVLSTVCGLDVAPPEVYNDQYGTCYIYLKDGKGSAKTTLVARDQNGREIKSPKVKYEIGKDSGENAVTPVAGLTVSNKGVISVAKTFLIDPEATYSLLVKASDYQGNNCQDALTVVFKTGNYGVKVFDVYKKTGEGEDATYTKATGQKIQMNVTPYWYAEDGDGNPIICKKDKDGNPIIDEQCVETNGYVPDTSLEVPDGYRIEYSINSNLRPQDFAGPIPIKYTLYGLDGSKLAVSVTLDYFTNSEDYTNIVVTDGKFLDSSDFLRAGQYVKSGSEIIVDKNKSNDSTGKIVAPNDVIYVSLCKGTDNIVGYGDLAMNIFAEGSLSVTGAKVVESDARKQNIGIVLTKPEAKVTLTKKITNAETHKQETKKFEWTIKNSALSKAKAPAASKVLVRKSGDPSYVQDVYADYAYNGYNIMEITLKEPLKDSDGAVITDASKVEVYPSNYEGLSSVLDTDSTNYFVNPIGNNKYTATIQILMKAGSLPSKKVSFDINYRNTDGSYLTGTPTTVTITPAKFKKSFAVNSTQTMSLKDGYSINIGTKSTGVKEVTYTGLLNYNKGGKYNNFADLYKINNNKLTVKDSDALFADSNVDKKGYPLPMDGYVECRVTYESGEVAYFTSKITVKWGSSQIGKYTIEKYDIPVSIYANYYVVKVRDASKNEVSYKEIKMANLKNDSPNITGVSEYGMGNLCVYIAENTKPGTYKSTALAVLEDSGCPHSGSQITDDEWAKYGVQVQIIVKVVQ